MADSQISSTPEIVTRKSAKAAGLKRYFTGKPCKHGHVDWRYVCDHSCAECCRQKVAADIKSNPEKRKRHQETRKLRRQASPQLRREAVKRTSDWVIKNKERVKEYRKEKYQAQKEDRLAYSKQRLERKRADPAWVEKERARKRAQHKKNPETKRCHVRKRRARIRGADGSHNAKDIAALLDLQKHKCVYCGTCLKDGYEVDHIIPISRGGSNWPSNIQILCKDCNRSKWCKDPIEFAKEKGWLF